MSNLLWVEGIGSPECTQISITGPIRRCMKLLTLPIRNGLWAFCTEAAFKFSGSPFFQLPFDINIASVQTRYHADRQPLYTQISITGPIRRCMKLVTLPIRNGLWAFCTKEAFAFSGSPSLQLPFDINIASVQTRYHADRQPRMYANFHYRPYTAMHETGNFADP